MVPESSRRCKVPHFLDRVTTIPKGVEQGDVAVRRAPPRISRIVRDVKKIQAFVRRRALAPTSSKPCANPTT